MEKQKIKKAISLLEAATGKKVILKEFEAASIRKPRTNEKFGKLKVYRYWDSQYDILNTVPGESTIIDRHGDYAEEGDFLYLVYDDLGNKIYVYWDDADGWRYIDGYMSS